MKIKLLFIALILLVPVVAYAHPGHGAPDSDGSSWRHYLTEPVHVIPLCLAVAAVTLIVVARRRRRRVG